MNLHVPIIILFFLIFEVEAQIPPPNPDAGVSNFRPSIAVVIGVLAIMFSLTFLILIYAKFCHRTPVDHLLQQQPVGLIRSTSRFSGIDKTVIESLPFFRFSSLRGSKEGLECAVCLSKFDETETLRLLPKCKHAFHVNCVDQWLESHSSCPLCRLKVDPEDVTIFMYSSSMRFSPSPSDLTDDPNLELFVRREPEDQGSSRFSVGSSFRRMENVIHEGTSLKDGITDENIVSDSILKNRWSDAGSTEFLFLNSHENDDKYLNRIDRRFAVSGSILPSETEVNMDNNSRVLKPNEKRSMSEIVNTSRFVDQFGVKSSRGSTSDGKTNMSREENMRRLWSPIAKRTVEWFAGRESKSKQTQLSIV